jgi:hypothetical protein
MSDDQDRIPAVDRLPRRATDRVEDLVAWVLTAGALLVVVIAVVAGLAVHGREVELGIDSASQARAVLLEDAAVMTGDYSMYRVVEVPARWTDRAGQEHTGAVLMTRSAPAGTEVDVWIDATGKITARPLHQVNPVFRGVVAAIAVLCLGAAVLVAAWLGVRRVTGLFNSRRWAREWARVEPTWRRTVL